MKTIITCTFVVLLTTLAAAATWSVAPDGTGDAATIQAALDLAAPGDIIELGDGVFTGPGNRDLDFGGKAVTVRSQSGQADACVIDCQGTVDDHHRGFWFHGGETADARVENLTITGGYLEADSPLPDGLGGAIMVMAESAPTLSGLILRENSGMSGGAICIWEGDPVIERCLFVDNSGWWGSGGAIALYFATVSTPIADCEFHGNWSIQAGGAISSSTSEFALERCIVADNALDHGNGGGLECFSESSVQVTECTFARNTAGSGGGAMIAWDSFATFQRCTFSENVADLGGSGLCSDGSDVRVTQCIIAFGDGASVALEDGGTVSIDCTDIYGNDGGDWVDAIAYQGNQAFNRSVDPLFCGDANPEEPYTLQPASPCVPGQYPCVQLGAWPVGCGTTAVQPPSVGGVLTLHGASPSPFNPRTSVVFSLQQEARVEIAVYDTRGRRIAVLADGVFAVGRASVDWNGRDAAGRDVPSGTYLVTARSAGESQTRKAVLVR